MFTSTKQHKKKHIRSVRKKFLFTNKGFSGFFVLVAVMFAVFMAGALSSVNTPNPVVGILDPNNRFSNLVDKKTLQLRTLNFVTPTLSPTDTPPPPAPPNGAPPNTALCQNQHVNTESEILVGYSPSQGQAAGVNGQIKVWVTDENPPCVGTGEIADPTSGQVTTQGNHTETATDGYLWEPSLNIGGIQYFPTIIKGTYNNGAKSGSTCETHMSILHGPAIDPAPGHTIDFTAEYIWDVNSLHLSTGTYPANFIIHDGDDDRGIGCVTITI